MRLLRVLLEASSVGFIGKPVELIDKRLMWYERDGMYRCDLNGLLIKGFVKVLRPPKRYISGICNDISILQDLMFTCNVNDVGVLP